MEPASADALAAAAKVMRSRLSLLGVQYTDVEVSGQNVVVTGPQSDEAQLKAVMAGGVLRVRQVLLEGEGLSGGRTVYGDQRLVHPGVLGLYNKLACRVGAADLTWKLQVGYTTSADWDDPDVQVVACDDDGTQYALDVAKVVGGEVISASATSSPVNDQWQVNVTFDNAGTTAFGALTARLYNSYYSSASSNQDDAALDQVAIVLDGDVVSAPLIQQAITGGVAQITGNFTRSAAQELAAELQAGSLPVDFQITTVITYAPTGSR